MDKTKEKMADQTSWLCLNFWKFINYTIWHSKLPKTCTVAKEKSETDRMEMGCNKPSNSCLFLVKIYFAKHLQSTTNTESKD